MESSAFDATDFRIINALIENGRMSFADLGPLVNLSPHGAADRVRRLIRAGVITGFTANVALAQIGRALDAFIDVRLLPETAPAAFERMVSSLPAVQEVTFVTGSFDYLVRVACLNTDELDETVRAIRQDAGGAQTETRIVLRALSCTHTLG